MTGRFGAVVTAMVTPFDRFGELDVDGAVRLARWLGAHGSTALVLAGTTGEGPTLSDAEKAELWQAVADAVDLPVIANAGTNDTRHSRALVDSANRAGVDGILAVTPYYNRPSQAGIEAHFAAICEATALPVMLYDIPGRTGRRIDQGVVLRLVDRYANMAGVKDATGDVAAAGRLAECTPETFDVYCGDDALTLPFLSVGAAGVISVAAHWAGPEFAAMCAAFGQGRTGDARRIDATLADSYAFESSDEAPNPVPAKAMMRVLGLPAGECRPPMGPAPNGLDAQARRLAEDLDRARARRTQTEGDAGALGA